MPRPASQAPPTGLAAFSSAPRVWLPPRRPAPTSQVRYGGFSGRPRHPTNSKATEVQPFEVVREGACPAGRRAPEGKVSWDELAARVQVRPTRLPGAGAPRPRRVCSPLISEGHNAGGKSTANGDTRKEATVPDSAAAAAAAQPPGQSTKWGQKTEKRAGPARGALRGDGGPAARNLPFHSEKLLTK